MNNIVNFSPHTCRAASSSKSKRTDVNINEILEEAIGKTEKNFSKYYDKEITEYARDDVTSIEFVELIILYDFYIVLLINWS